MLRILATLLLQLVQYKFSVLWGRNCQFKSLFYTTYLIILGQWVELKLLFRLARTFYQQDAQINLIKYLNNIQSVTSSNTLIIIPTIFAWKIMTQLTLRSVTSPWTGCRGRLTTQTLMTVRCLVITQAMVAMPAQIRDILTAQRMV